MIGTTLQNRYRLEAELGRGGMGTVYRAHDTLLDRDVAVKVLSHSGLGTEGRTRLLREAQAAARLNHPNIVSVHDVGEADGAPFVVMELVEGESLRRRQPKAIDEILSIARQVCAALDQAHSHGIIHRDLKPENIVITRTQTVKLMDFGLARTADAPQLTEEGAIVGTMAYIAPELIQGESASIQSDLYALGVMLYEFTTGQQPFAGDNLMAVLSQHLYATVVPPSTHNPEIPAALESLILQLLSKRPEERPASAAQILQALDQWQQDTAALARPKEISLLDRLVRGRLIGRDRELEQAVALWQQAASGAATSCVLLISGEPGIGKTRLARELAALAQLSRAVVLTGECYAEGNAPYAPLAQIIQAAGLSDLEDPKSLPPHVLADLITLAPALRARFPNLPPNPPIDPQAEQQRMYESVVEMCASLAPLLLVIDDAHWADGGTLALLRHLARRSRATRARLLVVLTYREVELDEARALNTMLHDLNRERLATRLKLGRLNREQTCEMLTAMFAEDIMPEFLDGIYRETEGNPFFVEEVCKALIEEGKLYRESGRWWRPGMDEIEIPQSVRVAIQTRVGKLPAGAQEALRLASLFGREFEFDALKEMGDLDEDALIDALEIAERAQLIGEARRALPVKGRACLAFAFAHALIPTTLRESIGSLRRQRLHRRAAQALERLHPDQLDELAPVLSRHFAEAGESDKAIEYLLKAGDRARGLYAYQEAIDAYEQALALLKEQGTHDRAARTLMNLGLMYHTTFDFRRSRQAYQEGFALWQRASQVQPEVSLPAAPHAFRMNWPEPLTLDPTVAYDLNSTGMIQHLFSGLVELRPEMDIVPDVAYSWEVLEGGRRYVFHLREDVCWSDGRPVTAGDFEYAWKRVLDPATGSPNAELLYDVKGSRTFHHGQAPTADGVGVRALDDLTLVVELEAPTGYFLNLLAYHATFPMPRHVVEQYGATWTDVGHIVSNGPFRLEAWQPGQSIILSRNPNYHGRFGGNVQRIEDCLCADGAVTLQMYEAGDLDIWGLVIRYAEMDRVRQRHAGEYFSGPRTETEYVEFDPSRPPFDDARVRRALVHAIDRKMLADVVLRGYESPATGGFVPPGMPGHSAGIGLAYEPDRARQLLAEAGYPGGRGFPVVTAWTDTDPARVEVIRALQAQWREKLGVEIGWEIFPWAVFLDKLHESRPHLFCHCWIADYPDPDNFLRVGLAQSYSQHWNATFDELVERARRSTDQAERMKLYQAADRILIEEAVMMPTTYGRWDLLIKPWVKKHPTSPIQQWFWKDVVIEPHP
jgi:ABC-type oligopeptide transport system substrate-binding subunit/predicted Ser/Thr protein kinase/tetratricopeptide (TPR) repeat protein